MLPAEIRRRCGAQDVAGRQDEDPQGEGGAVEEQGQRSSQRLCPVHGCWSHGQERYIAHSPLIICTSSNLFFVSCSELPVKHEISLFHRDAYTHCLLLCVHWQTERNICSTMDGWHRLVWRALYSTRDPWGWFAFCAPPGLVSDTGREESPLISLKKSNATPVKPHEGTARHDLWA